MNNVTLVGRLVRDPEVKEYEDGSFRTTVDLAVSRDYRNNDGVYDTDFIRCILWNGIANTTKEYCHKGDVVGIKGRLQSRNYQNDNNETKYLVEVLVDKVTFISTIKPKTKEKEVAI